MARLPALLPLVLLVLAGCQTQTGFTPEALARGPSAMVGNGPPLNAGPFAGGNDTLPAPREVPPPDDTRPPDCDGACISWCEAQGLTNPVNRGLCRSLWGVGLRPRPIDPLQACRRLFIDLRGRLPTADEVAQGCQGSWGEVVERLMAEEDFVRVNQRRAADRFLYSTEVVSVERIYDMDALVGKLYRGLIPYDLFAAVASAHPVLTRRYADAGDTVEALYRTFMGRPPFENERADMARLYALWQHGYVDHPQLGMRLPDAFLGFRCLTEDFTQPNPDTRGECTSVLWGHHELIFTPDLRASLDPRRGEPQMWSGLLSAEEWARLQVPGRILAGDLAFWEQAVEDVLEQYLGYDLAALVPEVRDELVRWLLAHDGDIRSVHHAVATSVAYLQSTDGETPTGYRWTVGPLKQVEAEVWLDSLSHLTGRTVASCDHRISRPGDFLEAGTLAAFRVLDDSRWQVVEGERARVDMSYAQLARTLGGCPENVVGGRFKVLSILTTATQLNYVREVCNPTLDGEATGAPIERLLPEGVGAARAVDGPLAEAIAGHQVRLFAGREADPEELLEARAAGEECALTRCSAEEFARPYCFALLSSAELLFY